VIHTEFWCRHLKEKTQLHRWENNIKMDVNEVGLEGTDRIGTSVNSCSPICDKVIQVVCFLQIYLPKHCIDLRDVCTECRGRFLGLRGGSDRRQENCI
jgi:hypothetical protein